MTAVAFQTIMGNSEGKVFRFSFLDGTELLATVISDTHVDEDGTIAVLKIGALRDECAWNLNFNEISSISPATRS